MRDTYFIMPKKTVQILGLDGTAEGRRSNNDRSQVIFTRIDMLKVQPALSTDEDGNQVIPEGYVRYQDIIIHNTVKAYGHEEMLTLTRKGKWVTKTKK